MKDCIDIKQAQQLARKAIPAAIPLMTISISLGASSLLTALALMNRKCIPRVACIILSEVLSSSIRWTSRVSRSSMLGVGFHP